MSDFTGNNDNGQKVVPAPNFQPREPPQHQHQANANNGNNNPTGGGRTYVYRDFANVDDPSVMLAGAGTASSMLLCHVGGKMPPQSLQNQKLPSKLGAMLNDPDLAPVITWMPHGRSWKILNRDLFAAFALQKYFGHSNHASFVRIINAWGFRRISIGVDRDSYYHELFLRGKPQLYNRMKRLPSSHRKTPVDKGDCCPDFYHLAKSSPLPEVAWGNNSGVGGGNVGSQALNMAAAAANNTNGYQGIVSASSGAGAAAFPTPPGLNINAANNMHGSMLSNITKPIHFGDGTGGAGFASNTAPSSAMNGFVVGNQMGSGGVLGRMGMSVSGTNDPMLSQLSSGSNGGNGGGAGNGYGMASSAQMNAYAQNLQQENQNLMLRIKILEYENQMRQQQPSGVVSHNDANNTKGGYANINTVGGGGGGGVGGGDTTAAIDGSMAAAAAPAFNNYANTSTVANALTTGELLEREHVLMQRNYHTSNINSVTANNNDSGSSGDMMNNDNSATSLL
mmetsp:Transcript_39759/g.95670  ORF Transcript_39759/g.95670 Transcript_39759/m.95670 type:complete len:508 (-) Transcript_39759:282-1805(-)